MKRFWAKMGLFDSTALLALLAAASRFVDGVPCQTDQDPRVIAFFNTSVQSVQKKLRTSERVSDGVVVSVLEFAYADVRHGFLVSV